MRILVVVSVGMLVLLAAMRDSALAEEIKISHQWAEGTDGRDRAIRVFVQEAEARSKDLDGSDALSIDFAHKRHL